MITIIAVVTVVVNLVPALMQLLSPPPLKQLNYENDIKFLNEMIAFRIDQYDKYIVSTAKASGRGLLTDKDLNKCKEEIVVQVYSCLSANYKKTLNKYFSEDGLMDYIVGNINDKITVLLIKHNQKYFNKIGLPTDNDILNQNKVDM